MDPQMLGLNVKNRNVGDRTHRPLLLQGVQLQTSFSVTIRLSHRLALLVEDHLICVDFLPAILKVIISRFQYI